MVGGWAGRKCMVYNTATDVWSIITSPLQVRKRGCAVEYQGKVLLCGGGANTYLPSCESTCEAYDPHTQQWTTSTVALPKQLGGHVMIKMK